MFIEVEPPMVRTPSGVPCDSLVSDYISLLTE
jgi:hypothetical protein